MKATRIRITGRVQGVGLRWRCKKTAQKLSIRGYVRNMDDGSVEVVCQGQETHIAELLKRMQGFAEIRGVTTEEIDEDTRLDAFTIFYT